MIGRSTWSLAAALLLGGCSVDGPRPETSWEMVEKQAFLRDRDRCRAVAERTIPYVDAGKKGAVAQRSYRVEGEIQGCMLSRGWNNPAFDGWRDGRD